jgi:ubiquinone/menaquinone biosynthesis C-methylase UbiE
VLVKKVCNIIAILYICTQSLGHFYIMKHFLLKLYNYPLLPPAQTNANQKHARDCEWEAIEPYIKQGNFLDVGCGAGYSMLKAKQIGCEVYGIDPDPLGHGVGRRKSEYTVPIENIAQGFSETLPYENNQFNTVYSSHVLEHVTSIEQSLREIKRVCNADGIIIIGVPTATMAWINWFTQLLFTTHQKIMNVIFRRLISTGQTFWWEIFIPRSHSYPNKKTVLSDVKNYKIKHWQKYIEKELTIQTIIKPCIYPYPEYRQLFRLQKNKKYSSSVFFVCKKLV